MRLSLSHIAIACPQIRDVASRLEALSLKAQAIQEVPSEKVRVSFVDIPVSSHFRIELLEATAPDSTVAKFLSTRPKGGLHHLSFEVEDIERWGQALRDSGIEVIAPGIRQAARGKALFIHPKEMGGVLVELEEIHGLPARS